MTQRTILLLFGGESTEHSVSLMSARNVFDAIDRAKFDVQLCYISQEGRWYLLDTFMQYESLSEAREIMPVLGGRSFVAGSDTLTPDVLLPILHGKNGEDGSVQGLAQLLHIPIVGCDMVSSALGIDKIAAKRIAAQIGVQVVPYMVYRKGYEAPDYEAICLQLGKVVFVKPSRAGSSVGVSKAADEAQLRSAIDEALKVDDVVLIEQALSVRELEVAILGNPPVHEVSCVGEILPGEDFYSYSDKYNPDSSSKLQIPADISADTTTHIQNQARQLFTELGAKGLARIDFFLTQQGDVYFNEINTLPGFTNVSMYPKLWNERKVSYTELITRLIETEIGEMVY